jgi:hypothetical protein
MSTIDCAKISAEQATSFSRPAAPAIAEAGLCLILVPNPKRFLCGSVGNAKKYRLLDCVVRAIPPGRDDKDVTSGPFKRLMRDRRHTLALDTNEDTSVG